MTKEKLTEKILLLVKKELETEILEQFTDFEIINNDFGIVEINSFDVLNDCKNKMKFTFNLFT